MKTTKLLLSLSCIAVLLAVVSVSSAFAQLNIDIDDTISVSSDDIQFGPDNCELLQAYAATNQVFSYDGPALLDGTITFGALLPLSGELSPVGTELKHAVELAVDDINTCLDEAGALWQLELEVEDTMTTPTVALEKIQALHAKGIDIIVGPATNDNAKNVLGYANSKNLLLASCCSTSSTLSIDNDSLFRFAPNDLNQGLAMGKLLEHEGIQAIVPVWRGDAYGDDLHNVVETGFADRGGILYPGIRYNPDTLEFGLETDLLSTHVTEAINEYGAENVAVLIISLATDGVSIMQSASNYQALKDVRWFGSEALSENIGIIEDPIVSEFANTVNLQTVQFMVSPGDVNGDVKKRITDAVGHTPISFVYPAYDSVWVLALSVEKATVPDTTAIKDIIHEVAAEYSGAMKSTVLDSSGDLTSADYRIWSLIDNTWTTQGIYIKNYDIITSPDQPKGEIEVASLYPLTGRLASKGSENLAGTQLGVNDFNAFLADMGMDWKLKLVPEDSATSPTVALEKVQTLFSKGIDIIIGPETSANTKHVMDYTDTNDMLLVSCCSTAPDLAIPNDSVFRLAPDDSKQGIALGKLMTEQGVSLVVPIWRNDAYGEGLFQSAQANLQERGGVMGAGIRYNPEASSFSSEVSLLAEYIQNLVDTHGSDKVAVLLIAFDESQDIVQTASHYPVLRDVRWFGGESLAKATPIIQDPIGNRFVNESGFMALQIAESRGGAYERVQGHIQEKYGRDPTTFVYQAYDASWLVGLSMLKTGMTDAASVKDVFRDIASNYDGALGSIVLNDAGDLVVDDYTIWTIIGTEWVEIGKYSISDDSIEMFDYDMGYIDDFEYPANDDAIIPGDSGASSSSSGD